MEAMDHQRAPAVEIVHTLVQPSPDQEFYILHAAGHACLCPFQPVVPQLDSNGNTVASRGACNTGCPLSSVERHNRRERPEDEPPFENDYYYVISCGGTPVERRVEIQHASRMEKVPSIVRPFNS